MGSLARKAGSPHAAAAARLEAWKEKRLTQGRSVSELSPVRGGAGAVQGLQPGALTWALLGSLGARALGPGSRTQQGCSPAPPHCFTASRGPRAAPGHAERCMNQQTVDLILLFAPHASACSHAGRGLQLHSVGHGAYAEHTVLSPLICLLCGLVPLNARLLLCPSFLETILGESEGSSGKRESPTAAGWVPGP